MLYYNHSKGQGMRRTGQGRAGHSLLNLYGGYLSAGRKYGDIDGIDNAGVSYFYYGASADIAYALTDYCTISGGIRYSQRDGGNEGEPVDHAELCGRERNLWFGAKVSFGF